MASANCCSADMSSEKIRRIPAVLAALVLAAVLVVYGLGSPAIIVKSTVTAVSDIPLSSDKAIPGKCNGCAGNEKGMAATACSAFCGAMIALPLAADRLDPYPPKPSILG